ncbi:DNA polymerase III subunit delta [Candidatus Peribacteria bacterium]|jgi:DNA polymerase III subunit delta|nr:DNA polymerase III subunit delta [Candidatus Peribacteria bacterium]MBT4021530.1 DNA polymerase III subunit delta [Candidatus Peribacteria bacterium]MBT4240619.1 DNA polymerase III subunit delta [Candidatus Peribacteria bacterium]MBT4474625.1 DNA polymerase III subunit delta [Candidatus Peribacteria bacterium]
MQNIYLFTGENTFSTAEELKRWKSNFIEKHGDANLQTISGKEMVFRDLLNEVQSQPFLSEKRLIVIEGMPGGISKEELEILKKDIHPDTLLVFVESSLDKRKSATKFLMKHAEVKTFNPLSQKDLVGWIINFCKSKGAEIDYKVASHLIETVGTDQWHLKSECMKLIAYSSGGLTSENVDKVCMPSEKHTVWLLSDLIGKGLTRDAAVLNKTLHKSGEDAFRLWNLFLWIVNNLSQIWMYQKEKNLSIGELTKEAGIPFPSAKSLLPLTKKIDEDKMKKIVERVVSADFALKNGEIKATAGEPIELVTLIEREMVGIG